MTNSDEATIDVAELSCAQRIEQLMRHRIDHYVAGRSDPSIYQSVRNMSQFVSDDYGNRFLIELIQNAHDAHDASRSDGEIAVVLDSDDGHGCLYVANRGTGFVEANLKAITNIALSTSSIGLSCCLERNAELGRSLLRTAGLSCYASRHCASRP
ncbi:hypothetical protein [Aquabacterium sp. J223]|uniref:hypothetical protein n=1 Tax=Aquabacterium sp. J223 TaxID=2898431 RepID=UPI0021ADA33F|nr:hypothetical protein [Aquabacterium sp. J223]UUX97280.1 hypothetical protein LRS07_08580 [Aquabacterium sp. J223]